MSAAPTAPPEAPPRPAGRTPTVRLLRLKPPRVRALPSGDAARRSVGSLSFVLLVCGLLAGGLLSLLMVNNSLAAGSFEQARLRADRTLLGEQEQALTKEVERASSPTQLRAAAKFLGMVPAATTTYVDLTTGRILGTPLPSGTTTIPGAPATPDAVTPVPGQPTPVASPGAADGVPSTGTGAPSDGTTATGDSATAPDTPAPAEPAAPGGDGAQAGPPVTAYDRAIASGGGP